MVDRDEAARRREDFRRLPTAVRREDLVAGRDAREVPDPQAGRDTERDFMLRWAAPI